MFFLILTGFCVTISTYCLKSETNPVGLTRSFFSPNDWSKKWR